MKNPVKQKKRRKKKLTKKKLNNSRVHTNEDTLYKSKI